MTTRLAHQTQKTAGIGNGMRTATIAAVNPLTLSVNGSQFSSGVGCLDSYNPVVGDTVAVFRQDSSWLVMGAIGNSGGLQSRVQQTGIFPVTISAVNILLGSVVFPIPFAQQPYVMTNLDTGSGNSRTWFSRASNPTVTGFDWRVAAGDGTATSFTANVEWVATSTV